MPNPIVNARGEDIERQGPCGQHLMVKAPYMKFVAQLLLPTPAQLEYL